MVGVPEGGHSRGPPGGQGGLGRKGVVLEMIPASLEP